MGDFWGVRTKDTHGVHAFSSFCKIAGTEKHANFASIVWNPYELQNLHDRSLVCSREPKCFCRSRGPLHPSIHQSMPLHVERVLCRVLHYSQIIATWCQCSHLLA